MSLTQMLSCFKFRPMTSRCLRLVTPKHQDYYSSNKIPNEEFLRNEILGTALKYVNDKGWTTEAINAAIHEKTIVNVRYVPIRVYNALGLLPLDLAWYFFNKCHKELEEHLSREKLDLYYALEWKMHQMVPYHPKYFQLIALVSSEDNIYRSMKGLRSWTSRRIGVASVYVHCELFMLSDRSESFEKTWLELERRVKEFQEFDEGRIAYLHNPFPELLRVEILRSVLQAMK